MPSPATFIHPPSFPANTRAHLRLELRLVGHLVPYLRPTVVLTNRDGWRL